MLRIEGYCVPWHVGVRTDWESAITAGAYTDVHWLCVLYVRCVRYVQAYTVGGRRLANRTRVFSLPFRPDLRRMYSGTARLHVVFNSSSFLQCYHFPSLLSNFGMKRLAVAFFIFKHGWVPGHGEPVLGRQGG